MADIRTQQFLYHLTDINNLRSIFAEGLKPRSLLHDFSDVADPDIISLRRTRKLEQYVPFHFFARNPFDGRVSINNRDKVFVLITVHRNHAQVNNWRIIPRHLLSGSHITLLNYDEGMAEIDWNTMNRRAYDDDECKCVCMAECLSPDIVSVNDFHSIYVPDSKTEKIVLALKQEYKLNVFINNNSHMFLGT